jgi:hypothetical protein
MILVSLYLREELVLFQSQLLKGCKIRYMIYEASVALDRYDPKDL